MNILENILAAKTDEVLRLKRKYSYSTISDTELFERKSLKIKNHDDRLSIISEVKKASPSKGLIRSQFDHIKIAKEYQASGTDSISVLTDDKFFSGNISCLRDIAEIKSVPLLRKDFIIDEIQVLESKANGADYILLICEALSSGRIKDLTQAAAETGLGVLLELHSADQIDKIDFSINNLIGINNRNLENFTVSFQATKDLCELISDDCTIISESGINSREDIETIKRTKASGILVGEHLMRADNIGKNFLQLREWCRRES